MDKSKVDFILSTAGFYEFVKSYSKNGYATIDYGSKLGKIEFASLLDADAKYVINSVASKEDFEYWGKVLNDENATPEELLIVCVTIFDWGGVTASNLRTVLDMYKSGELKPYIQLCRNFVRSDNLLETDSEENIEILWSAGWTKVYSAIDPQFLIYDSRVAAYLIYLLDKFHMSDYFQTNYEVEFLKLTSLLFTMGNTNRTRKINSNLKHMQNKPGALKAVNGNIVASWIIQLLCEKVFPENNERQLERAFFMLGFDLSQLKVK